MPFGAILLQIEKIKICCNEGLIVTRIKFIVLSRYKFINQLVTSGVDTTIKEHEVGI